MPVTIDRDGARTRTEDHSRRRHGGPVVLATFEGAPLDARSARLAVESAADMRSTLFFVEVLEARPGRRGAARATSPVAAALAETLETATSIAEEFGVAVETLRVSSLRPVAALLEFVEDRRPALIVFAADPAALRRFLRPTRRQCRRFVAALAEQAACLLWTAEAPSAPAATSAARRDWWRKQAETARAALNGTAAPTAWSSRQLMASNANRA
jgi:hypothetical protein